MNIRRSRCRCDGGYTLIELLVAAALLILLTALTCRVLADARTTIGIAADRADLQQRSRVGLEALVSALRGAGAGPDRGAIVGPLIRWVPPLWPGRSARDSAELSTAVTTIRVLTSVPPATLARDAAAGTALLEFDRGVGCPLPCGYADRMTVILLDGRGDFDLFALLDTDGASATVRHLAGGTGAAYPRGTPVLPVELRTYYLNARQRELRTHDGDRSDLPVLNDVVSLSFEYAGDPSPPSEPRPPAGDENCLYDPSGALRPGLQSLPRSDGTMAPLSAAILRDGPWCGEGAAPFDADLLRIRVVRLTLRLQTPNRSRRGTDSRWFHNPGSAVDPAGFVKDLTVRTTITPPNLGGWR